MAATPLSFQKMILTLHDYWSDKGCVILQPYDMEMGAGTFHPATTLRALGPETWNAAFVQPCRRPTDGRYGENPNRLQHYYQYQVILKPSPPDLQDLYLGSLAAIGVDMTKHDIRFVEDDWESPTLGAWGLGWEVWCDGMEVTQFTYFQQVGGIECDPVSVELTYGLDRLAMYLFDREEACAFRRRSRSANSLRRDHRVEERQRHADGRTAKGAAQPSATCWNSSSPKPCSSCGVRLTRRGLAPSTGDDFMKSSAARANGSGRSRRGRRYRPTSFIPWRSGWRSPVTAPS